MIHIYLKQTGQCIVVSNNASGLRLNRNKLVNIAINQELPMSQRNHYCVCVQTSCLKLMVCMPYCKKCCIVSAGNS